MLRWSLPNELTMIGQILRHYRIEAKLGAGGMGVVYRARDTHLDRSVAIKVLPAAALANRERRVRFVQEAKAASALSHPNIVTIHDIDTDNSGPSPVDFIAMEYIAGNTLDQLIGHKGLRLSDALRYGSQIADALAAAHSIGIVHRDLKPANIMVTEQGTVKLLDFGLAKLSEPLETDVFAATESLKLDLAQTEQGTILGTVAYMSPEQAEGHKVDARSDIFTFGAVLYEMVAGRKAFSGDSKVSTLASILHKEPPPLSETIEGAPQELERLIARCLKKDPQRRWQSMADIKVALAEVEEELDSIQTIAAREPVRKSSRLSRWLWPGLAVVALMAGMYLGSFVFKSPPPTFQRLTFRRGDVVGAKFAPDGQTIVYSAQWDTDPFTIFSTRQGSRESRSLDLPEGQILSISSSGEMAILLGGGGMGTLARAPLAGGAPREIVENVTDADWSPDGTNLAVLRRVGAKYRVEYPIGKVLYETDARPYSLRVSRKGDAVAFFDFDRDVGEYAVTLVDLKGAKRALSRAWRGMGWLGWSPKGDEIWFCGSKNGGDPALRAVTPSGKERVVMQMPSWTTIDDIAQDGRVLMNATNSRIGISYQSPDGSPERDLSWLDTSRPWALSRDGKTMLFVELSYGDGRNTAIYLRKTDGSPAVRLGDGIHPSLSPDGKWVLCVHADGALTQLVMLPTGPGDARNIGRQGMRYESAEWFPDGRRILFTASEPGHQPRTYVQSLDGGNPTPVTPEGTSTAFVSPDGKYAIVTARGKLSLCPLDGGDLKAIADIEPGETPIGWGENDNTLFLSKPEAGGGAGIYRLNLTTGKQELWRRLKPADPVGVTVREMTITPDGKSYAYAVQREMTNLYLAQGLR